MRHQVQSARAGRPSRSSRGEPSDAELLRLIAAGSEAAFGALFDRYGAAVYRVCREIVVDPDAAQDAAQEAFVRIWRAADRVDESRGNPTAWLLTVARNAARNVARVRVAAPVENASEVAATDADDVDAVDRVWVQAALTRLPENERVAVELACFADLSHSQIARRLGAPLGTVKTRLRRALGRLADMAEQR